MLAKPVFLLGAGASIDAGLSDTNKLTREIYKLLAAERQTLPAQVFGYVIAKILTRKVRQGGSPFDEVNVEEAYDGLERLIYRGRDITSEFVSSWDPFLESLRSPFNPDNFTAHLARSVRLTDRHSLSRGLSLEIDQGQLRSAAYEIANATASSATWEQANIQGHLIQALLKCLEHDTSRSEYMSQLMSLADRKAAIVASLNYDLLVEDVLTKNDQTYDYGLSSWNEKKLVSFANSRANIKLLKLHGSMNWYPGNDDTIFVDSERPIRAAPLMVFGGASGKLRADGPFLQLRHEFERQLLNTNVFVVVGYAFGDGHLNAIIRRWVSTRRKAKMIVVNPASIEFTTDMIGFPYKLSKERSLEAKTVDLSHIKKKAAAAVSDIVDDLDRPIDLSIPKNTQSYRGPFRIIE
jgi:hypothetical protein